MKGDASCGFRAVKKLRLYNREVYYSSRSRLPRPQFSLFTPPFFHAHLFEHRNVSCVVQRSICHIDFVVTYSLCTHLKYVKTVRCQITGSSRTQEQTEQETKEVIVAAPIIIAFAHHITSFAIGFWASANWVQRMPVVSQVE